MATDRGNPGEAVHPAILRKDRLRPLFQKRSSCCRLRSGGRSGPAEEWPAGPALKDEKVADSMVRGSGEKRRPRCKWPFKNAENALEGAVLASKSSGANRSRTASRFRCDSEVEQNVPLRIECVSIIQTFQPEPLLSASMVVFENGKPRQVRLPSSYTVRDVVSRAGRLRLHGGGSVKKTIRQGCQRTADAVSGSSHGGRRKRPARNVALAVLDGTGAEPRRFARWPGLPRTRSRRRGESRDKIYTFRGGQIRSTFGREGDVLLLFLQRVRDEAHRFAITFHQKPSAVPETSMRSALDDIPGIGRPPQAGRF